MSKAEGTTNKKKKLIPVFILCGVGAVCAAFLAAAGINAYLTDVDQAVNTFTIGEVTVDTLEPNWPGNGSDEVKDLVPLEEVKKDPQVKNTGKNRIVVFSRVDIPMKNIIVAKEDGTRLPKENTELFGFRTTDGEYNSFHSEKWVELSTSYLTEHGYPTERPVADKVSRLYGYETVVEEDETTLPVFDVVRLCNVVEGLDMLDNSAQNIVITTYAIQADNIAGVTNEEWTQTMNATKLSEIFAIYMNQSSEKTPDDSDSSNNQTLIGTTLNVTMTVQNTHLKLNSGNKADTETTTAYKVSYTGPNTAPIPEFASSNTNVVTVDEKGNIKAVGVGKAVITMSATNPDTNKVATASVTVTVRDMNSGEAVVNDLPASDTDTGSDAPAGDVVIGGDEAPADGGETSADSEAENQ